MNVRGIEEEETIQGLAVYLDTNQNVYYTSMHRLRVQQANVNHFTCKCRWKDTNVFTKVDKKLGVIPASKKNPALAFALAPCLEDNDGSLSLEEFQQAFELLATSPTSGMTLSCFVAAGCCWSSGAEKMFDWYICMVSVWPDWSRKRPARWMIQIKHPNWLPLLRFPMQKSGWSGRFQRLGKEMCRDKQFVHTWPLQAK